MRPDAWLEIEPRFAEALLGMEVAHELIVITWFHEANRDVLQNHPARRREASAYRCQSGSDFTPAHRLDRTRWYCTL